MVVVETNGDRVIVEIRAVKYLNVIWKWYVCQQINTFKNKPFTTESNTKKTKFQVFI